MNGPSRRVLWLLVLIVGSLALPPSLSGASEPIPPRCVEHTSFGAGPDYPGDYRCAGLAIDFHTGGAARSPAPLWAGQWLFVDEAGAYRLGLCTFNRGIHPTVNAPSTVVSQAFPNDASGARRAYLTWRYGNTTDDLSAAGLWAVFHYYAQDAAGSNRASNPSAPLVPRLDGLGEASGRQDIEDRAISMDAEAARFHQPFQLSVSASADGSVVVALLSGAEPVADVEIELTASGGVFDTGAAAVTASTDSSGLVNARILVDGDDQLVTVSAAAAAPGAPEVYRGAPADPVGHLPQTLITPGSATPLTASTDVSIPATTTAEPTTTTTTTTTAMTVPETTTTAAPTTTTTTSTTTSTTTMPSTTTTTTTTTIAPTTSTTMTPTTVTPTTSTVAPATTTMPVTTTTTTVESAAAVLTLPPALPVVPATPAPTQPFLVASLPTTGASHMPAIIGTGLLVAGLGLMGAIRRRFR